MNLEDKLAAFKKLVQSITTHDDEEQSTVQVAIDGARAILDDEEWRMKQRREARAAELKAKLGLSQSVAPDDSHVDRY